MLFLSHPLVSERCVFLLAEFLNNLLVSGNCPLLQHLALNWGKLYPFESGERLIYSNPCEVDNFFSLIWPEQSKKNDKLSS